MTATAIEVIEEHALPIEHDGMFRRLSIPMPETDDDLWTMVEQLWGVRLPRQACCPEHTAPFDVFAAAFFDREPVQVWKASRGFGGKSWLLGTLTITEAVLKGAQATILGGSASQSRNVHEVIHDSFARSELATALLSSPPTQYQTHLANGSWVRALMASQRSVRGPHPQKLRMDEIDEMDIDILDGALGQPMRRYNGITKMYIPAQTILSSTHQYPDGTMTAILKRAAENGWATHQWCYRCNLIGAPTNGWLTTDEVNGKFLLVPRHMWKAEYELQEPSFEGRAFDGPSIDRMFSLKPSVPGDPGKEYVFAQPERHRHYVTGVDWAREKDWTVIATFDATEPTWRLVAFQRVNKRKWQTMVGSLRARLDLYGGACAFDATGIGNVIRDIIEEHPKASMIPIVMSSPVRAALFQDYVNAVEQGGIVCPDVNFMHAEHRYCRIADLFGTASQGHPPDSVVAGALAWGQRSRRIELVAPDISLVQENPWGDEGERDTGGWNF